MTDGRTTRTSTQIAKQLDGEGRVTRVATLVAQQELSTARAGRVSTQVAVAVITEPDTVLVTGWGMIPIGISPSPV